MMRNRRAYSTAVAVIFIAVALLSCAAQREARAPDPERVQAFTEGVIARDGTVKVVLANSTGNPEGSACEPSPFRFFPGVDGTATWLDGNTLEFKPARPLEAGRDYAVEFDIGVAYGAASPTESYFSFAVRTERPGLDVSFGDFRALPTGTLELSGAIATSDDESDASIEKALAASLDGASLPITWKHERFRHEFTVREIRRADSARELGLSWSGRPIGADASGRESFRIPPAGAFEIIAIKGSASGDGYVEVVFSDAIKRGQDFRGLVELSGIQDPRYSVDGNVLRVHSGSRWPERVDVKVQGGVLSEDEKVLAQAGSSSVDARWELPQARFANSGVIVPTTTGVTVPIETMNLQAVYVEVLRIHGDNMLQFLQVNDLPGNKELTRVGKVVYSKVIELGWKDDWKNKWIASGLDLSPLVAKWNDGMFQIRINFGREQIKYVCPVSHSFTSLVFPPLAVSDSRIGEESYWDYAEDWYEYDWSERERFSKDPCHPLYYTKTYNHDIVARRNVMISDLGVALKAESDRTYRFAVTDMRTTQPKKGVAVRVYDFSQSEIGQAVTDANGFAVVKAAELPAFATASDGKQTSYVKIDDGAALSISHFDIGGRKLEGGVKGFIYGDRGVWRPGDDIYLTFLLWDRKDELPASHPVRFELENPRGQVVQSMPLTSSVNGFYRIDARTNSDAPTGSWIARVRVGNATFTKALKIESVMPNRLKATLSWGDKPYLTRDVRSMSIQAAWLTGAPASEMKADVSVTFNPAATEFPGYSGYSFDDPTRKVYSSRTSLFDDYLDEKGKATFDVSLDPDGAAPGKLSASFLTRVFEDSGMFSSEQFSVDFFPYDSYVGVKLPKGDARGMLLTDTDHVVDLALVDAEGKPLTGEVEVALYQIEWRWWWEAGADDLSEYSDSLYNRPIKTDKVKVVNGRGSWKFRVAYPTWGRFLVRAVDKSSDHASGKVCYIDWPGWAGKARGDSGGSASMLSLATDKAKYSVGETATVTFPSNVNTRALVTVERSGAILSQSWVVGGAETTTFKLPITAEMAPNVYVHVTMLQAHGQTANDLPIRLYGIVPVLVEDPDTRLRPLLGVPSEIAPESEAKFTVYEANGKPMTYTIAIVDEGLLSLTRYKTPNPWDNFYAKEASALKSWDLYQHVANAFSGKLQTLLAVGGSDDAGDGGNRKVNRFPPVVQFIGPKTLAAGEKATETFKVGRYFGAVRFMIVAGANLDSTGAAFGTFEKEVPVKAPLMTLITAPRVLSPGESCAVKATVFSYAGGRANVNVSIKVEGALKSGGTTSKSISFASDGDDLVEFPVSALETVGVGKITVTATSAGKTATQSIELEIRPVGVAVNDFTGNVVDPAKVQTLALEMPGMVGTNKVTLELSVFEPVDLTRRLGYLIGYPHGCAEQTVSKAFPQVALGEVVQLSKQQSDEARANVAAAIDKMDQYRTADGGFAFWPGESNSHEWLTAYVTHFLLAAKDYGHSVESALLEDAVESMRKASQSWNSTNQWSVATQAYRLYVLALAGKPDYAGMNRLKTAALDVESGCRLAAAFAKAGMLDVAKQLFSKIAPPAKWVVPEEVAYMTYSSELRGKAVMLETATLLSDSGRSYQYYKEISAALQREWWYSTQETAYALIALVPYVKSIVKAGTVSVNYIVNGVSTEVKLVKPAAAVSIDPGKATSISVAVQNKGGVPVYARLVADGVPMGGKEKEIQDRGLYLDIDYYDLDGRSVNPDAVPLREDMMIVVTVTNKAGKRLSNLALSQLLCAGWEIRNLRLGRAGDGPTDEEGGSSVPKGEYSYWWWWARPESVPLYAYQDIRDAAVYTYFDLLKGQTKSFKLYVNKTYEGRFLIPAVKVEAMYEPSILAVVPGRWIEQIPGR
jgi:hypothetical protein